MAASDRLTYATENGVVSFWFRGCLLARALVSQTYGWCMTECIRGIRRNIPDGNSRDGYQRAHAIWSDRQEVPYVAE